MAISEATAKAVLGDRAALASGAGFGDVLGANGILMDVVSGALTVG